jgi:S1-C subfamily serine protease
MNFSHFFLDFALSIASILLAVSGYLGTYLVQEVRNGVVLVQKTFSVPQNNHAEETYTDIPQEISESFESIPQTAALSDAVLPTLDPALADALVNIVCTHKDGDAVHISSGSGVVIDPKGVILTNAHVVQSLLFDETHEPTCAVRTGNPGRNSYEAHILYMSQKWIDANKKELAHPSLVGTGEYDYALLYITPRAGYNTPASYPFISFSTEIPTDVRDMRVIAAGYPSEEGVLEHSANILLNQHMETVSITKLFTYGESGIDVIGLSSSTIGHYGVSGGPVVTDTGILLGIIVTKGNSEKDGPGSLRALTLSYINTMLLSETGHTLSENIEGDIQKKAAQFKAAHILSQ